MASALWPGEKSDFLIALHGRRKPTDSEWDRYCALQAQSPSAERLCGVTITLGGAPNAAQRARLTKVHLARGVSRDSMGCVVSDSALVRGVVSTFLWLGLTQGTRAFALRDLHVALDYVGLRRDEKESFLDCLTDLGQAITDTNPTKVALAQASPR